MVRYTMIRQIMLYQLASSTGKHMSNSIYIDALYEFFKCFMRQPYYKITHIQHRNNHCHQEKIYLVFKYF